MLCNTFLFICTLFKSKRCHSYIDKTYVHIYTATYIYPIQIRVYMVPNFSMLWTNLVIKRKRETVFTFYDEEFVRRKWFFIQENLFEVVLNISFSTIKKYISWITKTIHNHILISLIHNCLSFQSIANRFVTNITWKESLSGDSYSIGKTHLNIRIEMEYIRTIDVQKLQVLSCTKYKTNNVKKYKIFVQINLANWGVWHFTNSSANIEMQYNK